MVCVCCVKDHSNSDMGYSFRLAAMVLLYAPSHRYDSTYHSPYYTSCGALAGMRNSNNNLKKDLCTECMDVTF